MIFLIDWQWIWFNNYFEDMKISIILIIITAMDTEIDSRYGKWFNPSDNIYI